MQGIIVAFIDYTWYITLRVAAQYDRRSNPSSELWKRSQLHITDEAVIEGRDNGVRLSTAHLLCGCL